MKDAGESKEKKEVKSWKNDLIDSVAIQPAKDPPFEEQSIVTCEYSRSSVTCEEEYVRRPMNAFMVWSRSERRKLALKFPNMLNCEISKLLGAEWSKMTENDKKPYVLESKKLRTIHSQKYPEYSYRPRRKKRKPEIGGTSSTVSTGVNSGFSCYSIGNNSENFENTYNGSFGNYSYYYDQFNNNPSYIPTLENQPNLCSNSQLNFLPSLTSRSDAKATHSFLPPFNASSTCLSAPNYSSDHLKMISSFPVQDTCPYPSSFSCSSSGFYTNLSSYINNNPNSESYDSKNQNYNFGTISSLFPEFVNAQCHDKTPAPSESNHFPVAVENNQSINVYHPTTSAN